MNIPLGYEIETGKRVGIPLNHTVVLGQTQLSGKTTTLEALVTRSGLRAVAFITKPGEKSFRLCTPIPAFFSESTTGEYWEYVISIIENKMKVHLGWQERGWVTKLCLDYERAKTRSRGGYKWKKPKTLRDLLSNVEIALPNLSGTQEMICIQLREYLKPAVREIERTQFSEKLDLSRGINVMDVTDLSEGLQILVIRSVIEFVHLRMRKTIVIVPEAWKFIPEGRSTPVKLALERLLRQGAGVENFVWMDSQDLRMVDKNLLRSVIVWLFGVQRQRNEVANTLDSIPDHPKPTATEIMQLGKGQFYVCYGSTLVRTYVQPAGMEDEHAKAIALGEEKPESWRGIVAALETQNVEDGATDNSSDDQIPESTTDGETRAIDRCGCDGRQVDEELMWKEKYEALEALHESLKADYAGVVEAHDRLAARLGKLENQSAKDPAPCSAGEPAGSEGESVARDASFGMPAVDLPDNLRLDAVYRYIVGRATKEHHPALIHLLVTRPEIQISLERKVIEANGSNLRGSLGILISEKFFDGVREFADVRRELIRRGFLGSKAPNLQISQALQGLVEFGFLTKEETGYQAVAGMKINIMEAK